MNRTARQIAYGALAAALIMVATAFIKIPGPVVGYMHLGDGVIYVMAMLLGARTGALAAGMGSALADLIGGFGMYAPVTFVVKGLMGYVAGAAARGGAMRRLTVFVLCQLIMMAGYFAFEWVVFGQGAAVGNLVFNGIQSAFGLVLGMSLTGGWMQRFANSLALEV